MIAAPNLPAWTVLPALALASAAAVRFMVGAGVLDRPDARKSHDRPTPKGGGVGVVLAVVAAALLGTVSDHGVFAPPALLAATGLAVLALLDDARDFRFTVKLGAQVLAAGVAVAAGLVVHRVRVPGLGTWELGAWSVPVTLGWILFTTNAVNFIDGLNGLAAGTCLVVAAALASFLPGTAVAACCLSVVAGLAGFLPFNYPRARIFMGDVGSQFLGYLLAVLSVGAAGVLPALTGPLLLAGILWDVLFTLVRRALARQRVWEPHRSHLYQIAQRTGVPAWAVAVVHWGFAGWGWVSAWALGGGLGWAIPAAIVPQLAWTAYVVRRARRAKLTRW